VKIIQALETLAAKWREVRAPKDRNDDYANGWEIAHELCADEIESTISAITSGTKNWELPEHFKAVWLGDWNTTIRGYAENYARATLSALTAEAGKGELPELPEPCFAQSLFVDGKCIAESYTSEQMREYARLALSTATPAGEWLPPDARPATGTYLVTNGTHVAPWINGIIHNNAGTQWDWSYGEAIIGWQPLPAPLAASPRGASESK
jgi:hypothetical protein